MKELTLRPVSAAHECKILCAEGAFEKCLPELIKKYPEVFVFTDENVLRLYGDKIESVCRAPIFSMPAGEEHKNEETLFALLRAMKEAGLHRSSCLIAVGGGVVGDIGGLAASLYMRGIDCICVPTTLLSQTDSSVGGKTAIDFCGVKNLVGAFSLPKAVVADPTFLKTLPPREIRCGLGEIVKHGALCGELFDKLYANRENLTDLNFLSSIIFENIAFKAGITQKDERESGLRRCLNLGHTTGHALELADGKLSHGEYVLLGMLLEGRLAERETEVDPAYLDKLFKLCLAALGSLPDIKTEGAFGLAALDKKNTKGGEIAVVAPAKRGKYAELRLTLAKYEEGVKRALAEVYHA